MSADLAAGPGPSRAAKARPSIWQRISHRLWRWVGSQLTAHLADTPYRYGQHPIRIGSNSKLANGVLNARSGSITIGNNVVFGHNVMVLTGVHDYSRMGEFRETVEDAGRDIVIGDNVWIASGSIIIGPVVIGADSVVAAGSIVSRDVPEAVLVSGNPARVIRSFREPTSPSHDY